MADALQFDLELDELSDHFGRTAEAVQVFNRRLFIASLSRLLQPVTGLREQFALSGFAYGRRFFLTKERSGRVLVFLRRRRRSNEVVIDCRVDLQVVPTPQPLPPVERIARTPLIYRWVPPYFLILEQKQIDLVLEQITTLGNAPARKEWVVLAVGRDGKERLAIATNKNDKVRQIWFGHQQGGRLYQIGRKTSPAAPFLALYQSLRNWMAGDHLTPSSVLDIDDRNDVQKIVHQLASAFGKIRAGLAGKTADQTSPLWQQAAIHYEAADYRSSLLLRLDEEGNLATRNAGRSFQLQLHLALTVKEGYHLAMLQMAIPDFLTHGPLYQSFWDAVKRDERTIQRLASLFRERKFDLDEETLTYYLEANRMGGASVLRIDRVYERKIRAFVDTNLFVWEIEQAGELTPVMFSAKFIVTNRADAFSVSLFEEDPALRAPYHALAKTLDQEVVSYFISLAGYLHNWRGIL